MRTRREKTMTDYTNLPAELMAIHISIYVFLDRYEDLINENLDNSMKELSGNILQYLKDSK